MQYDDDQVIQQLTRQVEERRQQLQNRLEHLKAYGQGQSEEATRVEGVLRDFEQKWSANWQELSEPVIAEMKGWLERSA